MPSATPHFVCYPSLDMNKISSMILVWCVGLLFIGIGTYMIAQSYQATMHDLSATGHVVDVSIGRGSKGGTVYAPVIDFQTPDGATHRFVSSMSSSWRPTIGATEPVLYDPSQPDVAIQHNLFDMYGFPGIFAAMGAFAIFLGSFLPMIIASRHRRKEERLRSIGHPVQAEITGVAPNGTTINNMMYYAISAQWTDSATNQVHLLKSFGIPFDPSESLKDKKEVTVYVNPSNSKDYWMDTSFLPKVV